SGCPHRLRRRPTRSMDPRDSGSPSVKPTHGLALDSAAGARTGRRHGLRARMTELDLDALDRDGALRETAAGLPRETRRDFLLATLAGGGAALAALAAAEPASSATSNDVA